VTFVKRIEPQENWPSSWKSSYQFDLEEVYGRITNRGYAYAYAQRRRAVFRLIVEVLPPGARILDLAAAQGNFSIALAEMGYDVTWNDLRSELADYVRLKQEFGTIHFVPGDAFEIDLPEESFDAVVVTELIEHLAHPDHFLARAAQLARPGGYVIMTTPNGAYFRNRLPKFSEAADPAIYESVQFQPDHDGHIFLMYPEEIGPLARQAGLVVETMSLFSNPLTSGHVKTGPILRCLPRSVIEGIETLSHRLPPRLTRKVMTQLAVRFRRRG
jgi:2-polyprenyl-6-hydroxyphenyl methylase/3-demethylubiquinone-9 3-methyltransferase